MNDQMIRVGKWVAVTLLMTGLLACSQGMVRQAPGGRGGMKPYDLDPRANLYATTVKDAKAGDCSEDTLTKLTCFAARGRGFEGAQTALGKCLIENGQAKQGAEWIAMAANADWADAELLMAELAQQGVGVPKDPIEAAKWSYLYTQNPSMVSLGIQPNRGLHNQLMSELSSEQLEQARQRASDFTATFKQPEVRLTQKAREACRVRQVPVVDEIAPYNPDGNTPPRPN